MKLIIDIPEDIYKFVCQLSCEDSYHYDDVVLTSVKNGTPIPDNATNGGVIMAMFPSLEIEYTDTDEYTNKPRYVKLIIGDIIITRMSADRWNAPYQKGGKG